jgi:hypothetical protein
MTERTVASEGDMITGLPIEDFKQGYAVVPFKGEKAHHWSLAGGGQMLVSGCGLFIHYNDKARPLDPGDFPLCQRCERIESAA